MVSVNCAPITAGTLVESSQVTGGVRSSVDCNVNPGAFVGQERVGLQGHGVMHSRRNRRHAALRREGHRRLAIAVVSPGHHRVGGNCRLRDARSGPGAKEEEERHRKSDAKELIFHNSALFR